MRAAGQTSAVRAGPGCGPGYVKICAAGRAAGRMIQLRGGAGRGGAGRGGAGRGGAGRGGAGRGGAGRGGAGRGGAGRGGAGRGGAGRGGAGRGGAGRGGAGPRAQVTAGRAAGYLCGKISGAG